jgi:hypothetical protein
LFMLGGRIFQKTVCIPMEVFFIRINKKVGGKRSTLGTHRNADCLLKNTSTTLSRSFNFTFCYIDVSIDGVYFDRIYHIVHVTLAMNPVICHE